MLIASIIVMYLAFVLLVGYTRYVYSRGFKEGAEAAIYGINN